MPAVPHSLAYVFERFVRSGQGGAALLLACAIVALVVSNSPLGPAWLGFWHTPVGALSLEAWVNDALMAVFFLLIGLELKRELLAGELASRDRALLPVFAAVGGMAVPALIHLALNAGTPTSRGFGIPMATDIAFTLGVLALLGRRIPLALRVFVVAFAVIDDLGAILVIAGFYSATPSWPWLAAALALWGVLYAANRVAGIQSLALYLPVGAALWFCTLQSGVHATLAGVALAFAMPFHGRGGPSASARLEHGLSRPVAFVILPIFALANAGVTLGGSADARTFDANGIGIIAGLVAGKPLGIVLACLFATTVMRLALPAGIRWSHVFGAGLLGGIGFTMSIFIGNLAFVADPAHIAGSKLAVMLASVISAFAGYVWLSLSARRGGMT